VDTWDKPEQDELFERATFFRLWDMRDEGTPD
jgi:hypothetical protein